MKSFNKVLVGLFAGMTLLGGATFAQASGLTQAQISAVIGLLQSFGADANTINNVSISLGGGGYSGGGSSNACPTISYNLYLGLTDAQTAGQVSALQRYLSVNPTGYFGTLTRAAVANFQTQNQIYPVTGGVGPLTRATLARCGGTSTPPNNIGTFNFNSAFSLVLGQTATESTQGQFTVKLLSVSGSTAQVTLGQNCAQGTQCFYYPTQTVTMQLNQPVTFQGYTITLVDIMSNSTYNEYATFFASNSNSSMGGGALNASPTSGAAPLGVNFSASVPSSANYVIDYGDGTNSGQLNLIYPPCVASATTCNPLANVSHIYQNAGTYTASLSSYIACLYATPHCLVPQPAPIASVTITVGGAQTCSGTCSPIITSITPTSGPVGTVVTVNGGNFTNDNIVHFGNGGVQHIVSGNGTSLSFTVPSSVGAICQTSQPCPTYLQLITAGTYPVSVSNIYGQSGATNFTVTGQGLSSGISLTQPTAGQVFTRGQDMPVSWSSDSSIPSNASVILDLYTSVGTKIGTFAVATGASGSTTWHIPGFPQNYMCTQQYPNGLCGTNIPTGQYYVKASAMADGFNSNSQLYGTAQSGTFTINQQ